MSASCFVCCLVPTSCAPMQVAQIATSSSTTTGGARVAEQEHEQSAPSPSYASSHSTQEHDATCRQGQGRPTKEHGMRNQVRDTQPTNRGRTLSRIGKKWRVHESYGDAMKTLTRAARPCHPVFSSHELANREV